MLSSDTCALLRTTAERGVLAPQQSDDTIHVAWKYQEHVCPVCQEDVPWHRGLLYQNGQQVAWVCMLCAVLEIGAWKPSLPSSIGTHDPLHSVPLPPGFILAWLNTDWIPRSEGYPVPSAIEVAKLLGPDAGNRIWAALIEDRNAARLDRPRNATPESSPWRPFLLARGESRISKSAQLLDYAGTEEEVTTSMFVHRSTRLHQLVLEVVDLGFREGKPSRMFFLEDDTLSSISGMSSKGRCSTIPRTGLVHHNEWESTRAKDEFGIHRFAKVARFDQHRDLYLIPFDVCGEFYFLEKGHLWMQKITDYCDEVGFDYASRLDKDNLETNIENLKQESLWNRVFGDALVPEGTHSPNPN